MLAIIALVFFWGDGPKLRFGVFAMLFIAFVGFGGVAIYQEAEKNVAGADAAEAGVTGQEAPPDDCSRDIPAVEYDKCIEQQKQRR